MYSYYLRVIGSNCFTLLRYSIDIFTMFATIANLYLRIIEKVAKVLEISIYRGYLTDFRNILEQIFK